MKPDEALFLRQIATKGNQSVRDLMNTPGFPLHHKRARYLLLKWTRKGFYNYGVSLDLGWLTARGKAVAKMASLVLPENAP